jgi:hypothetical protein
MGAANNELVDEGGLHPPEYMRDRRWNRARKRYLIAKQRLDEVRRNDQLRFEREQAWDDVHQRHISSRNHQAAVLPQHPSLCIVCDSMASSYPINVPEAAVADYAAWWERPGALVTEYIHARQTPPRSQNRRRRRTHTTRGDPNLRAIIRCERRDFPVLQAWRKVWEDQWARATAVRRKHDLAENAEIPEEYWQRPIGGVLSWWQHQLNEEDKRKEERKARGNRSRPKPPRSSLSMSETADDVPLDPGTLEILLQKEEREAVERALERATGRVAAEVGYLYFVGGGIDHLEEWKEDYEISDGTLVLRNETPIESDDGDGIQGAWDGMDLDD